MNAFTMADVPAAAASAVPPPPQQQKDSVVVGTKRKESFLSIDENQEFSLESVRQHLQAGGTLLPSKPKTKSIYVRFKAHYVKELTDTSIEVDNVTTAAKNAWNQVKKLNFCYEESNDHVDNEKKEIPLAKLFKFKVAAQEEERKERAAYKEELENATTAFARIVTSVLKDLVSLVKAEREPLTADAIDSNSSNVESLHDLMDGVIQAVQDAMKPWDDVWSSTVKKPSLTPAQQLMRLLESDCSSLRLVKKLKTASMEQLLEHANTHQKALDDQAKWNKVLEAKAEKDRLQQEKEQEIVEAAATIQPQIAKQFHSMMKYEKSFKHSFQRLEVTMDDIVPAAFEAAFGVKKGLKTKTLSADEFGIQTKPLRYGAILACRDVTVSLSGKRLLAVTRYTMEKPGSLYGMMF